MASIPCATYKAGDIHNQMRRQRYRHLSTTSSDSATSDGAPLTPSATFTAPPATFTASPATFTAAPVQNSSTTDMQNASQVTIRDRMDRVSQWVKKLYHYPTTPAQNRIPEQTITNKTTDSGTDSSIASSRGSMIQSET